MINLRKVIKDDAQLLFKWINEPDSRANAVNPKLILWNEHVAWLERKLSDESVFMYILNDSSEDMGVIRFDSSPEGFIISYSIDKDYRGRGLGSTILKMGMEKINEMIENPILIGYVKKGNIASEKIFNRFNFSIERKEMIRGIEFIVYKK